MAAREYIQVAGFSQIYIAFPDTWPAVSGFDLGYDKPHKIGEQMDETQLTKNFMFHDVPGDRNGGPQGQPIEVQDLGFNVSGTLNLSRFNPQVIDVLEKGFRAVGGKILDSEVGELLLLENSVRITIKPSKITQISAGNTPTGPGDDYFFHNFPCCLIRQPRQLSQGSKFSKLQMQFTAYRAPSGHPSEFVVHDRDETGFVTP
jgi:hypothetical protein